MMKPVEKKKEEKRKKRLLFNPHPPPCLCVLERNDAAIN
jgi:hypothetical protein